MQRGGGSCETPGIGGALIEESLSIVNEAYGDEVEEIMATLTVSHDRPDTTQEKVAPRVDEDHEVTPLDVPCARVMQAPSAFTHTSKQTPHSPNHAN